MKNCICHYGCRDAGRRAGGFTLIELVVIIVIIGALALVAGPRFTGRDSFDSRGFFDKAAATVRFAQKTAVAWRGVVCVTTTATQISVSGGPGCATPVPNPVTGAAAETAPSGVTLNAVTFGFDGLGRPVVDSAGTVLTAVTTITFTSTIADDPARQIVVQPETGYVLAN